VPVPQKIARLVWGSFCQVRSQHTTSFFTSFFLMKVCRYALDHEKSARIEIPNRISHASIPRGARWWRMITLAYLYAVGRQGPNHDAIMRIESEAPRWRLHSSQRRKVHVGLRRHHLGSA